MAARLKKPAYGMNDAPWTWWNRVDAAVKNMGLCPARADRCTFVSYSDVKKHKKIHMAYSTEKIEKGPLRVRTPMVYLNVESDVNMIMDYIIDLVAGRQW